MHEIGLVDDILCVINAKLKELGEDSKVKKINMLISEFSHISADHFEFHFRERTKGTLLEDAELKFKKVNDVIRGAGIRVESIEI